MSEHQPPPTSGTTTGTTPPPSAATASANPGIGAAGTEPSRPGPRPRIAIQYCTQCKWMLRAAYFAQELLSTFSTDLQEVSLVPSTGGIFTVTIYHTPGSTESESETTQSTQSDGQEIATRLWDRKTDGGFPVTSTSSNVQTQGQGQSESNADAGTKECEDCR
ncbi:SelT/SelW/SelH family protein [Aspergillus affinis]|uniref:SelT/SelW/SelH family protein n=1 Tax=Aspergillus affinis TaxID=1070780 RepID=UPI0022FEDBBE|nr:uncharacterized protein KD926_008631 [Aspergillus affinis]KAI9040068.1 hypothetical protein KD926_008631 [Aspergillus affinis]